MKRLTVVFDAGAMIAATKSGVGYYSLGLISALANQYPEEIQLIGYYFNFLGKNHVTLPDLPENVQLVPIRIVPGKLISLSRKLGINPYLELFFRRRFDVLLTTNYVSLPTIQKAKHVLVVYDLSYVDHPEYLQERNLRNLQKWLPKMIDSANTIIVISEFTKTRLLQHFPEASRKDTITTPIPPATPNPNPGALSENLQAIGITSQKYILYVGTLEPRKNIENLLDAYAKLSLTLRENFALVLAGGKGWKDEGILAKLKHYQDKGLHIIQTGYITDSEKEQLYTHAKLFVFPSYYEGFGMPIAEAMARSLPCAVSNIPVFHEVAGNAAVYFDPSSPVDIASALDKLLTNPGLRQRAASTGKMEIQKWTWKTVAQDVFKALKTSGSQ